eukprot:9089984-Alexandrium_andersonii.AAC.1
MFRLALPNPANIPQLSDNRCATRIANRGALRLFSGTTGRANRRGEASRRGKARRYGYAG